MAGATLKALEESLISGSVLLTEEPAESEDAELETLRARLEKRTFPRGPADQTAFVDYVRFALATEAVYQLPGGLQPDPSEALARNGWINEVVKAVGDRVGKPLLSPDVATSLSKLQGTAAYRAIAGTLDSVADVNPNDANEVDLKKIRELAKTIDGLIDVAGYSFGVFQPDTVNIGLMATYRQTWVPQNYQTGELLSTIPLTPGEKVKYETKTWATTKTTQEINESSTYSTEEILSTTRRDISELLMRTSKKLGGRIESNGKANLGVFSGSASVKTSVDYESESKATRQQFAEEIAKTSQSIRDERKVAINIAAESGSEERQTREISNPNNEITVTYLFYELQRLYSVTQCLHSLTPVVFVANAVPAAIEITDSWISRHDWIIAGAILDKSFIPTLSFMTNELPGLKYARDRANSAYDLTKGVVEAIKEQIGRERERMELALRTLKGETEPKPTLTELLEAARTVRETRARIASLEKQLGKPLEMLRQTEEAASKAEFEYERGRKRADRLLNHIRDNILHYMAAIWDSENLYQRYLRLRSILYPHVSLKGADVDPDANIANPKFEIIGWMPLADVVDTNRVLGYVGNYSVYTLLRDDNAMVNWLAASFPSPDADKSDKKEPDIVVKVPSDCVYIEALPGTTHLLEPFKLRHRKLDVEKVRQEVVKQRIENLRRLELIKKGDLGDPDIEKTVVADAKGALLSRIAGIEP